MLWLLSQISFALVATRICKQVYKVHVCLVSTKPTLTGQGTKQTCLRTQQPMIDSSLLLSAPTITVEGASLLQESSSSYSTELPHGTNQYNNIVLLTKCIVHTAQYTRCLQTTRVVIKIIRAHTLMVSREFVTCSLLFAFLLTLLKMAVQFNRPTKYPLSKVKVGKSDDIFCIKA